MQIADGNNGTIAIYKDWKDNRYDVFVDGKIYGISIKNLDVSDGGVYTCRFIVKENTVVQEIMDEIHVTVEGENTFKLFHFLSCSCFRKHKI